VSNQNGMILACVLIWMGILAGSSGCPNPETGKVDPYLTARTIINQGPVAVALAEGIFNQWALAQTDAEKVKQKRAIFEKIKTAVVNGLQLALNGVDIAEQAKKDPNVKDLLAVANEAWGSLRQFLDDLLSKSEDANGRVAVAAAPTSQPATGGEIKTRTSALTQKVSPLHNLPKTLGGG
jgi:hypothetical protein